MQNLILIFVFLGLGVFFRRFRILPEVAPAVLNRFVIWVPLPAITLLHLHRLAISLRTGATSVASLQPALMAWILFLFTAGFFSVVGRALGWNRKRIGCLTLTAGLGNTSFVGFPLLEALYGPGALATGVLVDQPGTFLVMSVLGNAVAAFYSGDRLSAGVLAKKVLFFPPFLAMVAAVLLSPFAFSHEWETSLERIGFVLIPLAITAVGMQLGFGREALREIWQERRGLLWGLGFKLAIAPAFIAAIYAGLLRGRGEVTQIVILEAAMAPMITGTILAIESGLEPRLAGLMVGLGIPLSLITVPLLFWALH